MERADHGVLFEAPKQAFRVAVAVAISSLTGQALFAREIAWTEDAVATAKASFFYERLSTFVQIGARYIVSVMFSRPRRFAVYACFVCRERQTQAEWKQISSTGLDALSEGKRS